MLATAIGGIVVRDERFGAAGRSILPVPQVSIIITASNAAETLSYSLASLARQTMPAWEAIIVDDGSEDGTDALAGQYAAHDDRVRVVRQYTRGASVARNRGVSEASAEWLLFVDAGDELEPHALEQLLRAAARHPSVSVIHGGWAQLTRDGLRVDEGAPQPEGDLFDLLARESAFPIHACMIRRVLVQAAGGWDATLSFGEDWDLWQRVARMGVRFGAAHARVALSRSRDRRGAAFAMPPGRMVEDGVRVLRRGHAPDPRVCSPSPRHMQGRCADPTPNLYHFACWCAGRLLANGDDARAALDALNNARFPELDPAGVADAILRGVRDAAPDVAAQPSSLRRCILSGLDPYLDELERTSGAPRLAVATRAALEVRLTAIERLHRHAALV